MNVLILTGAGISAESGIPTFRGADGLWEGHRIEDVATSEGFQRNPEDPERFRPERFIERSYSLFEYMRFGGGHRRCIGAAFASYEMAIVLGSLLKRFEFELVETVPVVSKRRNITMGASTAEPLRFLGPR